MCMCADGWGGWSVMCERELVLGVIKMRCQTVVNNTINVGDKMELVVVASNAMQQMDAVRRVLSC